MEPLCFWFGNTPFSNFYQEPFIHQGIKFSHSEAAFMWHKAKLFNDKEAMLELTQFISPKRAKDIGRRVRNYDDATWAQARYECMKAVLLDKFSQGKSAQYMSENRNRTYYEASPVDFIWGCGLAEDRLRKRNFVYPGQNLLGKCLMEVRDILYPCQ